MPTLGFRGGLPVAALLVAASASAAALPRAALYARPAPHWAPALGGSLSAGTPELKAANALLAPLGAGVDPARLLAAAGPLAVALESEGLTPARFWDLGEAGRALAVRRALEAAAEAARVELSASLGELGREGGSAEDAALRLGSLQGRLGVLLDAESLAKARRGYRAALAKTGPDARERIRRLVEAGTADWSAAAPGGAPAVAAAPGRAAAAARLGPSSRFASVDAKLLKGSLYDARFLAEERARAAATPTLTIDLDGTAGHPTDDGFLLRPGVVEQLEKLRAAGFRLVLWTNSGRSNARRALTAHPALAELFELVITRENAQPFRFGEDPAEGGRTYMAVYGEGNRAADAFILNNGKDIALLGHRMIVDDSPRIAKPMPNGQVPVGLQIRTWSGEAEREEMITLADRIMARLESAGVRAPKSGPPSP